MNFDYEAATVVGMLVAMALVSYLCTPSNSRGNPRPAKKVSFSAYYGTQTEATRSLVCALEEALGVENTQWLIQKPFTVLRYADKPADDVYWDGVHFPVFDKVIDCGDSRHVRLFKKTLSEVITEARQNEQSKSTQ